MIKFTALAFVAAGMLAVGTAFAGEGHACCAKSASNEAKQGCDMTFANLNLSAEQKEKLEKVAAECHKGGCTEATMAKMNQDAEKILSKEQFETWKASHSTKPAPGKTQS
jgi:ketol-acid reductoisomerase